MTHGTQEAPCVAILGVGAGLGLEVIGGSLETSLLHGLPAALYHRMQMRD